jgi:hypothetical protein
MLPCCVHRFQARGNHSFGTCRAKPGKMALKRGEGHFPPPLLLTGQMRHRQGGGRCQKSPKCVNDKGREVSRRSFRAPPKGVSYLDTIRFRTTVIYLGRCSQWSENTSCKPIRDSSGISPGPVLVLCIGHRDVEVGEAQRFGRLGGKPLACGVHDVRDPEAAELPHRAPVGGRMVRTPPSSH